MELGEKDGRNVVLAEYKKAVKSQFYSANGNPKNTKASQLRRILSDFKNMAVFQTDLVSLILYRVECAVDFTNDFGDIDSVFYESAINAFAQATKIIAAEKLQAQFAERCEGIVVQSSGIGWGFHDDLKEIHYDCFGTKLESLGFRASKTRLVVD